MEFIEGNNKIDKKEGKKMRTETLWIVKQNICVDDIFLLSLIRTLSCYILFALSSKPSDEQKQFSYAFRSSLFHKAKIGWALRLEHWACKKCIRTTKNKSNKMDLHKNLMRWSISFPLLMKARRRQSEREKTKEKNPKMKNQSKVKNVWNSEQLKKIHSTTQRLP